MWTLYLVSFTVCLSVTYGQAPGDYSLSCRKGIHAPEHIFPMEWKVLVDTYDYVNLFAGTIPPPVWKEGDIDGDTSNWQQLFSGSCQWNMRACTFETAGQNNWLFSQFISYEDAVEVYFNVTFDFYSCVRRMNCTKDYVTLYQYNHNGIANDAERTNTSNYQPLFGSVEASRLQQPSGATREVGQTLSLTRPSNSDGFYLGIRDEGTCGDVIRIIVYYVVCPLRVEGLVTYPETALPVQNSSDIVFDAVCAPNAHNTTTLEVIASSNSNNCSAKEMGGAICQCNAGYVLNSTTSMSCEACEAGTYRTLNDDSCQLCPANNTVKDMEAATECRCVDGFYRNDKEGPEISCTEPPSECRDLEVVSRTDTTITLRWTQPEITGRSDFFYRILYSDPDNIGGYLLVNDNLIDSRNRVAYTVSGLRPFTSYQMKVTTHNGVSDQDPNSHLRQCLVNATTGEPCCEMDGSCPPPIAITPCPPIDCPLPTCPTCPSCPTCSPSLMTTPNNCPECPTNIITCPECPTQTTCLTPGQSVTGIIEAQSSIIVALDFPVMNESITLVFSSTSREIRKRQMSQSIVIEIDVPPRVSLVRVPKQKFNKLVKGETYSVHIKGSNGTSFEYQYKEEFVQPVTEKLSDDNEDDNIATYIVVTAVISVIVTAIIAGAIMIGIITCLLKKNEDFAYQNNKGNNYIKHRPIEVTEV